jgi:hypothetical protein
MARRGQGKLSWLLGGYSSERREMFRAAMVVGKTHIQERADAWDAYRSGPRPDACWLLCTGDGLRDLVAEPSAADEGHSRTTDGEISTGGL